MAGTLRPEDWVEVLRRLPCDDHGPLASATDAVTDAVWDARWMWARESKLLAHLVTLYGGQVVCVATPTEHGYTLNGTYTPRKEFVRAYTLLLASLITSVSGGDCVVTYWAWDEAVSKSISLSSRGHVVYEGHRMVTWPASRVSVPVGCEVVPAMLYIRMRLGQPKRQRGRRAKRWTRDFT